MTNQKSAKYLKQQRPCAAQNSTHQTLDEEAVRRSILNKEGPSAAKPEAALSIQAPHSWARSFLLPFSYGRERGSNTDVASAFTHCLVSNPSLQIRFGPYLLCQQKAQDTYEGHSICTCMHSRHEVGKKVVDYIRLIALPYGVQIFSRASEAQREPGVNAVDRYHPAENT
eukprot:212712-Pelagomonas_calceolata.AAC.2